jgi:hypothetical protein
MVLLDTCTLLWLVSAQPQFSRSTVQLSGFGVGEYGRGSAIILAQRRQGAKGRSNVEFGMRNAE